MDLQRLRYFLTLARTLHFGKAAEQLHISQPGLSQQIRKLEQELGTVLLTRGRPTQLTPAGATLAESAHALLEHEERVRTEVRRVASGERGLLRLALSRSAPTYLGHDLVEQFRRAHPSIDVQIESAWSSYNLELVRSGRVDAAMVQLPITDDAGVDSLELARVELAAILPARHQLARSRRKITLEEVRSEPYVAWPRDQAPGAWDRLMSIMWQGIEPLTPRVEPDLERMITAVGDGHGFTVATEPRARQLRRPGVTVRNFAKPGPDYIYGLCWLKSDRRPVVRALIDSVRDS